jgi:hypothetical protein
MVLAPLQKKFSHLCKVIEVDLANELGGGLSLIHGGTAIGADASDA